MSQLILVRHGQAAAFQPNSDRLTELGRRQAEQLGKYWVSHGVGFDEVYVGTLQRQVETERLVADAYAAAGLAWPLAQTRPGWNEYDAGEIMGQLSPVLEAREPSFLRLVADFRAHSQDRDRNRYFQRMFETLMDVWVRGEIGADGVESFAAFHARVSAARAEVLTGEGSRRVAVFTSGGPIGACVQLALEAPPPMTMRLNWRVKNGSLTEMTFSGMSRMSLDTFNTTGHLDDTLQSFR
jgi:broad specificity phosphatase PhoE